MLEKVNQALIRYLKALLLLSISLLFVCMTVNLISPFKLMPTPFVAMLFNALLLCGAIVIPIKWVKILSKIFITLVGLAFMAFVVVVPTFNTLSALPTGELLSTLFTLIVHVALWVMLIVTTLKEGEQDVLNPETAHQNNIKFFKKYCLIIGGTLGVILILLFIFNSKLISTLLNGIIIPLAFFLIIDLLLIRVSRDTIYLGVESISKQNLLLKYGIIGGGSAVIIALFIIFKNKLNLMWAGLVAWVQNLIKSIEGLWQNLVIYGERLNKSAKPPTLGEIDFSNGNPYTPDFNPEIPPISDNQLETLKDLFGLMENANVEGGNLGGIGGNIEDVGGIGSIPTPGEGLYDNAGNIINSLISESGKFGFSAESLIAGALGGNAGTIALVSADKDATNVYLRLKSFGHYNGKGFEDANAYTKLYQNKYSMNNVIGFNIQKRFGEEYKNTIHIQSFSGQRFLPYYMADGTGSTYMINDIMAEATAETSYSVDFYTNNDTTLNLYSRNSDYEQFVKDNYINLPSATYDKVNAFLKERGLTHNMTLKEKIDGVFNILSEYKYSLKYNKELDSQKDVVVAFLEGYSDNQGICQHFAGSAVVMLRCLNVPARYVGGLMVGNMKANTYYSVTGNAAHAWVEIFQENLSWVRIDPTTVATVIDEIPITSFPSDAYKELIESVETGGTIGGGNTGGGGTIGGGNTGDGGTTGGGNTGDGGTTGGGNTGDGGTIGGGTTGGTWGENFENIWNGNGVTTGDIGGTNQTITPTEPTIPKPTEIPWGTILTVVGSILVTAAVVFAVIFVKLKKKKDKYKKDVIDTENKTQEQIAEEESNIAKALIRENYKTFIKTAGNNGISKQLSDTTQSLRDKYTRLITTEDAMDILTGLYRIARYDKKELLTMEDAEKSLECLEIITKSFKKRTKNV